ncbi:MAG TPA: SDR family oxidoreductase [Verrucomicrobiae bacterium]|nr:SDR family oxidoreductase [Verrucomicrobiae bacterium]
MKKRLAWVTGARGLIGNYLVQTTQACAPAFEVIPLTRADLDLLNFDAVQDRFSRERPDVIIHCAALSRSPECQANPDLAHKLNVQLTSILSRLAADIPLVFFSTDLVFDGQKGNYDETAAPRPLSVYAQTKVDAEKIILSNPNHTVVRTSLNGGQSPTRDRGFNEQIRRAWEAGKNLTLFTDEFRCPIAAAVTARAVWELVTRERPGLYHLAGRERLSRWQIGQLMAARWPKFQSQIAPGSAADYPGAPRSPDTSLNCDKIQALLSFPLPGLTEWLAAHPDEEF